MMKNAPGVALLIIVIACTVVIGYVARNVRSSEANVKLSFTQDVPVAPTQCTFTAGDFNITMRGMLYFDGLLMRGELYQVNRGIVDHIHMIKDHSARLWVWSDEHKNFSDKDIAIDFTKKPLDCA